MNKFNWLMKGCGVFLLWGTVAVALPAPTKEISAPAPTFTSLLSFDGVNGSFPFAALVQGTDGKLYGTTVAGHFNNFGRVFGITPRGTLTVERAFHNTDGAFPQAPLVQGSDGNFYGTTMEGGAYGGLGTVFRITPGSGLTTLHSFDLSDGEFPRAGLVQGTDGNFYGTTWQGGTGACSDGCGTIFKITPAGSFTTLYSFCTQSQCTDGESPSGLIQATDGNFYGTAYGGGAHDYGTVFKITPNGTLTTVHSFDKPGGTNPMSCLVEATDGNFYGTTYFGGTDGFGTVFRITPGGMLTTLHSFQIADGASPDAPLIQGTDGDLYGTTSDGGTSAAGTLFKITTSGALTTLYSFDGMDGSTPEAALVQDTNGMFYGTTSNGGIYTGDFGTVFSLSVGLGPFVKPQPASGAVGMVVNILGTDLTDATSVTFNGTPSTFTVVARSYIATTVPAGATTGMVQVTAPGRSTLSSNVPFTVTP